MIQGKIYQQNGLKTVEIIRDIETDDKIEFQTYLQDDSKVLDLRSGFLTYVENSEDLKGIYLQPFSYKLSE